MAGIALNCGGAFCLTCLDLTVGTFDRSSQRSLCIVGGALLIAAGVAVLAMLRAAG